jgi:hypothetical protein
MSRPFRSVTRRSPRDNFSVGDVRRKTEGSRFPPACVRDRAQAHKTTTGPRRKRAAAALIVLSASRKAPKFFSFLSHDELLSLTFEVEPTKAIDDADITDALCDFQVLSAANALFSAE